ncbi:MAG TPA: DUF5684 domain-containing protein [Terriglobia bacterium]|nr:DUF5684 domain-containing protein [Terriglobia bacterium]
MKLRTRVWARLGLLAVLVAFLIPSMAWAQDDRNAGMAIAAAGAFFLVFLVFGLAFYVYIALALSTIAKKTNTENPWMAWIPIVNVYLMVMIAKKEWWWLLLCLIPFVNIVIYIILWMAIAEARHKPNWWGILIIVPFVGLIVPGYLAWAD